MYGCMRGAGWYTWGNFGWRSGIRRATKLNAKILHSLMIMITQLLVPSWFVGMIRTLILLGLSFLLSTFFTLDCFTVLIYPSSFPVHASYLLLSSASFVLLLRIYWCGAIGTLPFSYAHLLDWCFFLLFFISNEKRGARFLKYIYLFIYLYTFTIAHSKREITHPRLAYATPAFLAAS